jgi:hypothetical protein
MIGQYSRNNLAASLGSILIPGTGQFLQGRRLAAAGWFSIAALFWIMFTFLDIQFAAVVSFVHLWSSVDAAKYLPKASL